MYRYTCGYLHVRACIYVYIYIITYLHIYKICMLTYISYIYIHIHICMHLYIYIYIYIGWWFQPLGQNISQLGLLFPIYGKIRKCSKFQTTSIYIRYLHIYLCIYWVISGWAHPPRRPYNTPGQSIFFPQLQSVKSGHGVTIVCCYRYGDGDPCRREILWMAGRVLLLNCSIIHGKLRSLLLEIYFVHQEAAIMIIESY